MSMLSDASAFHEGLRFDSPDPSVSATVEFGVGTGLVPEETIVAGAACTIWREEPPIEEFLKIPEDAEPASGSYI